MNYVPYHMHSDYSLLDSCTKFEEYVDMAVENNMKAIASTEHGLPRGWYRKKKYCDKKGIKFIYGVEIYLTESLFNSNEQKVRDNYHTVLLAKNKKGIAEINRLVDLSTQDDHFYYNNRITFDEFLRISDDIITTSACLASPLNRLPVDHDMFYKLAKKYSYYEIQPHNAEAQKVFNARLNNLSERFGIPLIAGTDTHSLDTYKAECRQIILDAKNQSYGDEDSFDLTFKTYNQLAEMFKVQNTLDDDTYLQAIENTNTMSAMIEDFEVDESIKYPILYGDAKTDSEKFREVTEEKFKIKVNTGVIPPEQVDGFRKAIDEEITVFEKLGMSGFMLSMSELISWCKENDIPIGPGRGSVGGSRVAYVTDIIDVNPEKWKTVFSRFCNEHRTEVGD